MIYIYYPIFIISFICRCKVCGKQYSEKGIRYHMQKHDPESSFILECDLCGKKFSRMIVLRGHIRGHLPRKKSDTARLKSPCPICKKV